MIKKMLLYGLLPFVTGYMLFAFVCWDVAWVANAGWLARVLFILVFIILQCLARLADAVAGALKEWRRQDD